MTGIVAVHCGAGFHNSKYYSKYNKLVKRACFKGIKILREGGNALEAVEAMIVVLEDDSLTNAGFGSNLTSDGRVEVDASIMDGKTLMYGGCAAIRNLKNPIKLAYDICIKQSKTLSLGRIPPSLLVGAGGLLHAKRIGLKIYNNKSLISQKALNQYKKYKKWLDNANKQTELDSNRLDTVGAVCIDDSGHVAAACSSGGILLKRPGRVGQAALYACGSWADSFNPNNEPSVAVCTTGCGEHLIQTQLAKEIAEDLKISSCPTIGLNKTMTEKFLSKILQQNETHIPIAISKLMSYQIFYLMESRYLRNVHKKLGGALVLYVDNKTGDVSILWGHSTKSMSVGFMRVTDDKPKATISLLSNTTAVGTTINVSGTYFYKNSDGSFQ